MKYLDVAAFSVFGLSGLAIFCVQAYTWAKHGYWQPYSALDALVYLNSGKPVFSEWKGIAQAFDFFPASLSLIGIGTAIVIGTQEES